MKFFSHTKIGVGVFALLLTGGAQAPGAPALPPEHRVEPILALNVQPPDAAWQLAHLRELRIRHVRSSWWRWSTREDWSWIPAYREAGVEVLPLVLADENDDFRGRLSALLRAWGPFPYVQLGNEMDGGLPAGARARERGRFWGERIRAAAPIARQAGVKIVAPGAAWNSPGVKDYLRGLIEGAAGTIDVLAVHPYGVHVYGEPLSRYLEVRALGWTGPIWATEIGVSDAEARYAGANSDRWQEENVRRVFTQDESRHGWDRIYWFQLTPAPGQWGLLRHPGRQRRPAYEWMRSRP